MLIQLHSALECGQEIKIEKRIGKRDVTHLGAFACGERITYCVKVPRMIGASAVVMRMAKDGGEDRDVHLDFLESDHGCDVYETEIDTEAICEGEGYGLFYYEFLFVRGWETLFSDSVNNVDMRLSEKSASRFRLLVHETEYETPAWFKGGTMYHVFADRFFRGEGETQLHGDAEINPDWHHGIPQYARKNGDPLSNHIFFGGNLWGVAQKLDYLESLGVTVIYLSPVFQAYSNHRYDTGDYEKIDSILGGEEAFDHLVKEAHARGIKIILDGVFNHTGDDSKYFNKRGNYEENGAYQSPKSPYYDWFSFKSFPDSYECWWNIEIMPRLNQQNENCRRYFTAKDGICDRWIARGADGWRLDVVDELPNEFLDELRRTIKERSRGDALIIGEVWENAADKIAYGKRRRYFSGRQLDSVMNYPFRNAVLAFLLERDAQTFYHILTELYASYPTVASNALMNLLGTHDTERILTVLGDGKKGEDCTNDTLAHLRLTEAERERATKLLQMGSALQFTVFGVPSVYYGDEVGLEGYHDPFCRMPFPWGEENETLLAHYRALGEMRKRCAVLGDGAFRFVAVRDDAFAFERTNEQSTLLILANMGADWKYPLSGKWRNALTGEPIAIPKNGITVPSEGFLVLEKI